MADQKSEEKLTGADVTISAEAAAAIAAVEAETATSAAETGADATAASATGEEVVAKAELEALKTERDQLLDRLARLQAEFENARKRAEREKQEFREFATGQVVEAFLPVLDNFELALKSAGTADQLRTGVELIVKQMDDVLKGLQVQAIPTIGVEFNPYHHEALGSVERTDLPDHQVAEEIRKGYRLRERLLRPALVRIVSNPKQVSE